MQLVMTLSKLLFGAFMLLGGVLGDTLRPPPRAHLRVRRASSRPPCSRGSPRPPGTSRWRGRWTGWPTRPWGRSPSPWSSASSPPTRPRRPSASSWASPRSASPSARWRRGSSSRRSAGAAGFAAPALVGRAGRPGRAALRAGDAAPPERRRIDGLGALGVAIALLALVFAVIGASNQGWGHHAGAPVPGRGSGGAGRVRLVGAPGGRPAARPLALPQPRPERRAPQRDADRAGDGGRDPSAALLLPERPGAAGGARAAPHHAHGGGGRGLLARRGRLPGAGAGRGR